MIALKLFWKEAKNGKKKKGKKMKRKRVSKPNSVYVSKAKLRNGAVTSLRRTRNGDYNHKLRSLAKE